MKNEPIRQILIEVKRRLTPETRLGGPRKWEAVHWNDAPGRTYENVVKLLNDGIARCES